MSKVVIGVTGGVASGKTEVTRHFETLGIYVADADIASRAVLDIGSEGLAEVVALFGSAVLNPDGSLDRAAMRKHIFNDDAAKKTLEAIVHPRVRVMLRDDCFSAESRYAIASVPLLAESGGHAAYPWLTRILVVDVPVETQMQRLLKRDGVTEQLAARMIHAQASRQERLAIADDVIENTGSIADLHRHVEAFDKRYTELVHSIVID